MSVFTPVLLLALGASPSHAMEPVFRANIGASYWGLGLKVTAIPGVRQRLWGEDGSMLFGDTFLKGEWIVDATPAYVRSGPQITFSPIAVFQASAHCVGSYYFGNFSTIVGFETAGEPYDADAQEARAEFQDSGWGTRCGADATLQAKVGPVMAATWAGPARWVTHPGADVQGDYFFESESAVMLKTGGDTLWQANGVLIYEHWLDKDAGRRLLVGDMTNYLTSVETGDVNARTGLMLVYEPNPRWNYLLIVQAYLASREYTEPFPPYIAGRVQWTMPGK